MKAASVLPDDFKRVESTFRIDTGDNFDINFWIFHIINLACMEPVADIPVCFLPVSVCGFEVSDRVDSVFGGVEPTQRMIL
jgi:hypothetical protein